MARRCLCRTVLLTAAVVYAVSAVEFANKNVFYLDEAKQPPLELKALRRAPIRFSRESDSVIAYLAKGQPVTVLALGESVDYISVHTATDMVQGWVDTSAIESPPAELLKTLRERSERAAALRELIANHEIASGMTADEVRASLGKPDRRSNVRLPAGNQVQEQWEYISYRYLPTYHNDTDENGRLRQVVSYQRVPAGRKIVLFQGGAVVSVMEEAGQGLALPGGVAMPKQPNAAN